MSATRPSLVKYGRASKTRNSTSHRDDRAVPAAKKQRVAVIEHDSESDHEVPHYGVQIAQDLHASSSMSRSPSPHLAVMPHQRATPTKASTSTRTRVPASPDEAIRRRAYEHMKPARPTASAHPHISSTVPHTSVTNISTGPSKATPTRKPSAASIPTSLGTNTGLKRRSSAVEVTSSKRQRVQDKKNDSGRIELTAEDNYIAPTPVSSPTKRNVATRPDFSVSSSASPPTKRPTTPTATMRSVTPTSSASRPGTPSKQNALSQIFGPVSPTRSRTPSPTKIGVAKRMLGRSRTESSIGNAVNDSASTSSFGGTSQSPALLRTYTSLPARRMSGSSGPASLQQRPNSRDTSPSRPQSTPSQVSRLTMRTYASARSFLVALPQGAAVPSHLKSEDLDEHDLAPNQESQESFASIDAELQQEQESYSALRALYGVDAVENDDIGLITDLKSGSEMKIQGEARMFWDEVGYLLEGLESTLLGVQRTSAIELLERMCTDDFVRKARSADFLNRAWGALVATTDAVRDPILRLCMGVFCAIISQDPRDLGVLAASNHFSSVINALLDIEPDKDVLRLAQTRIPQEVGKRLGLKRNEIPLVESIRRVLSDEARIFLLPASSPKLASTVVAQVPPVAFLPHISQIVASTERELQRLSVRGHLELDGSGPDVEHLRQCMRVLDALLLSPEGSEACAAVLGRSKEKNAFGFVRLLTTAQRMLAEDVVMPIAHDTIDTTLRILVNLTNGDAEWCDSLLDAGALPVLAYLIVRNHHERKLQPMDLMDSQDTAISSAQSGSDPLDRLCLGLAVVTNVVQETDRVGEELLSTSLAWKCQGSSDCLPECACDERTSALELLVAIYVEQGIKTENDVDSAEANFLRGHVAVLLALIAQQTPRAIATVRAGTPLRPLLDTCRDWLATFELSAKRLAGSQGSALDASGHALDKVKDAIVALSASL